MWFRKKKEPVRPSAPIRYPDGIAVSTEESTYFIKNGKRYRFFSDACLDSWRVSPVVGSKASLSKTPHGGVLGFRDGTLIWNYADGKVYLISNNRRRHVTSPYIYDEMGLDEKGVLKVSDAEASLHEDGEDLNGI